MTIRDDASGEIATLEPTQVEMNACNLLQFRWLHSRFLALRHTQMTNERTESTDNQKDTTKALAIARSTIQSFDARLGNVKLAWRAIN